MPFPSRVFVLCYFIAIYSPKYTNQVKGENKSESFLTFFQLAFWKQSVHLNKYKETLKTSFI